MKIFETFLHDTVKVVKELNLDPYTISDEDLIFCEELAGVPAHYRSAVAQLKHEQYGSLQQVSIDLGLAPKSVEHVVLHTPDDFDFIDEDEYNDIMDEYEYLYEEEL